MGDWIAANLSGPMATLFYPANAFLSAIDTPGIAKFCAMGMFVAAGIGVFMLKKEYVNMSAPRKGILFDLRFWALAAMSPHAFIYFWLGT